MNRDVLRLHPWLPLHTHWRTSVPLHKEGLKPFRSGFNKSQRSYVSCSYLDKDKLQKRFYFGPRKGGRRKDQGEASRSFSPNANNSQIIIKMVMNLLLASHAMWRKFSFSAFALLIYSALCRNGAGDSFVDDVIQRLLLSSFSPTKAVATSQPSHPLISTNNRRSHFIKTWNSFASFSPWVGWTKRHVYHAFRAMGLKPHQRKAIGLAHPSNFSSISRPLFGPEKNSVKNSIKN